MFSWIPRNGIPPEFLSEFRCNFSRNSVATRHGILYDSGGIQLLWTFPKLCLKNSLSPWRNLYFNLCKYAVDNNNSIMIHGIPSEITHGISRNFYTELYYVENFLRNPAEFIPSDLFCGIPRRVLTEFRQLRIPSEIFLTE